MPPEELQNILNTYEKIAISNIERENLESSIRIYKDLIHEIQISANHDDDTKKFLIEQLTPTLTRMELDLKML